MHRLSASTIAVLLLASLVAAQALPPARSVAEADTLTPASSTPSTQTNASDASNSASSTTSVATSQSAASSTDVLGASAASSSSAISTDDLSVKASSTAPEVQHSPAGQDGSSLSSSTASVESVNDTATTSSASLVGGSASSSQSATSTGGLGSPQPALAGGGAATDTPQDASSSQSVAQSSSPSGGSAAEKIVTGTASAFANILNIVNATFLNSTGAILFANLTEPVEGRLDLRDPAAFKGLCDGAPCAGLQGIEINLLVDAKIANNIFVSAHTGGNAIEDASSSAAIETGDAFAGLNLVNLANVTIAGSRYFLLTLNAFRDIKGDIIFPSLYGFRTDEGGSVASSTVSNTAAVANHVGAGAGAGDNTTADIAGGSAITTGTSTAKVNVFNQLNTTLLGQGLAIMLRTAPGWNGAIYGLPDWARVEREGDGIFIFGDPSRFGEGGMQAVTLDASSSAEIGNDAFVEALTGGNSIEHGSSTALIATGNALAGANVINVANQTVIGRNWLLAILNVFGDFTGDISFGMPDLWVGDRASAPNAVGDGDPITYTLTVRNNGDAPAHDVVLTETPDLSHVSVIGASMDFATSSGKLLFNLGTLDPGASVDVTYQARARDVGIGSSIANETKVSENEPDNNEADNTDSVTLRGSRATGGGGGGWYAPPPPASVATTTVQTGSITITRLTEMATSSKASDTAVEKLAILNGGDVPAEGVHVRDVLRNPDGYAIHVEDFDLGAIASREEVDVQYEFQFASSTPGGRYSLATITDGGNVAATTYQNGDIYFDAPLPLPMPDPFIGLLGKPIRSLRGLELGAL